MEEQWKKLDDNIWQTRKCRILASERLNANEKFCRFISIYYSIITTALTIINMISTEDKKIDVIILIVSIAVTYFLMYMDTKNYKERYLAFKKNYLDLDKLRTKIVTVEDKKDINKYNEIAFEYNELLREVENHTEYDYIKLALRTKELKEKVDLKKKITYYLKAVSRGIVYLIAIALPLLFVVMQIIRFFNV